MTAAPILPTQGLRELLLAASPPHLSAASGLVCVGQHLYVVADDEFGLAVFDLDGSAPGRLLDWAPEPLPSDPASRKAAKPDLEALVELPPQPQWRQGALLAMGSGSRPARERAFLLPLDPAGRVAGPAQAIDLTPLYTALRSVLGELNIEGAFFSGERLTLLQRGGRQRSNACLRFDAAAFVHWLAGEAPVPRLLAHAVLDLGDIDGVPLALTDGAALGADGRWLYSAAAEDTADSYNDGACLGSVLGVVDAAGRLQQQRRLDSAWKVEGVAVLPSAAPWEVLLVTDADDRRLPARLLRCSWPAG